MSLLQDRIDEGYRDLADAIILQAVDDYRRLLQNKRPTARDYGKSSIAEIENFIKSEYYRILTNIDGKRLMKKLQKEANQMKLKSENGNVTFIMRAGKDKVKSQMSAKEVSKLINSSNDVVETATEIIVDDKYFFPADVEKKSHKKNKTGDVSENE